MKSKFVGNTRDWNLQGYYNTFDAGYKDSEGNVFVMARTDDIINVGAVRLSTGAVEEVLFTSTLTWAHTFPIDIHIYIIYNMYI